MGELRFTVVCDTDKNEIIFKGFGVDKYKKMMSSVAADILAEITPPIKKAVGKYLIKDGMEFETGYVTKDLKTKNKGGKL